MHKSMKYMLKLSALKGRSNQCPLHLRSYAGIEMFENHFVNIFAETSIANHGLRKIAVSWIPLRYSSSIAAIWQH